MNLTAETLAIFMYLIPGFLSSLILNSVVVRKSKANLSKLVEALVFSFTIYVIISIFTGQSPVAINVSTVNDATTYVTTFNESVLVPVFLLALLLPLAIGASITHDWHMKLLRSIQVTNKTSRETIWLDVFTDLKKRNVVVNLTDGTRVFGWPMYYSNNPEEGKLYLYSPAYFKEDGQIQKLPIHGMFIVNKDKIDTIEFLHTRKEKSDAQENG